jgi:hypothetical protein
VKTKTRPIITEEQQIILDGVQVRLIEPFERERCDQLICQQHYLKDAHVVGEQLRYVAEYKGQWVGLFIWSAAAYSLKQRETWIGWSPKQKKRRLPLGVNNSRFLILDGFHIPNLASRIMKLCLGRLGADWQAAYGHEVLVAETFVDSQKFRGTCYKASGWTLLGKTQGCRRVHEDFYERHDRPKQLWVCELQPGARTILRGRNLPAALQALDQKHPPECPLDAGEIKKMRGFFAGLPEWRTGDCDFPVSVLVTITVCAMLAKVTLGQRDLAAFAKDLTREQMAALGFPRAGKPARYRFPKETTFFRLLTNLDSRCLERALLAWLDHVLGRRDSVGDLVAVDGKELLNSQGMAIVSAYSVQEGRWLGSEPVAEGSNEIPAAQALLRRAPIEGSLVVADALHTQTETGQIIVQEKGADYLFTVKANQKGIRRNAQQLFQGLMRDFSPSAGNEFYAEL